MTPVSPRTAHRDHRTGVIQRCVARAEAPRTTAGPLSNEAATAGTLAFGAPQRRPMTEGHADRTRDAVSDKALGHGERVPPVARRTDETDRQHLARPRRYDRHLPPPLPTPRDPLRGLPHRRTPRSAVTAARGMGIYRHFRSVQDGGGIGNLHLRLDDTTVATLALQPTYTWTTASKPGTVASKAFWTTTGLRRSRSEDMGGKSECAVSSAGRPQTQQRIHGSFRSSKSRPTIPGRAERPDLRAVPGTAPAFTVRPGAPDREVLTIAEHRSAHGTRNEGRAR
jgi:hypothetical protein